MPRLPMSALLILLPLQAQPLQKLLQPIPRDFEGIQIVFHPKEFLQRTKTVEHAFTTRSQSFTSDFGLQDDLGVRPMIQARFGESGRLILLEHSHIPPLLKKLKAERKDMLWRYTVELPGTLPSQGATRQERWAGQKGPLLLLSNDRKLLERALAQTGPLNAELKQLLSEVHPAESAFYIPGRGLQKMLDGMGQALPLTSGMPKLPATTPWMEGIRQKLRSKLDHAVAHLDLPKEGGFRFESSLVFQSQNPWSDVTQATHAHPLAACPSGPYALALGGSGLMAMGAGFLSADARMQAFQESQRKLLRSAALCWGPPAQPSLPLFSNLLTVLDVTDIQAYGKALEDLFKGRPGMQYQEIQSSGVEGWTLQVDLASILPSMPPAQLTMLTAVLFGGSSLRFTLGRTPEGRLLGLFGGPEELKAALNRSGSLMSDPKVQITNTALYPDPQFTLLFHPQGTWNLTQGFISSLLGPKGDRQQVPDSPPVAFSLAQRKQSLDFCFVAPAPSMPALAALYKGMEGLFGNGASKLTPTNPAK